MHGNIVCVDGFTKNKYTRGVECGIKSNIDDIKTFMFIRIYMYNNKILVATSACDKNKLNKLLKNYKNQFLDSILING